jgi:hypothetical protein
MGLQGMAYAAGGYRSGPQGGPLLLRFRPVTIVTCTVITTFPLLQRGMNLEHLVIFGSVAGKAEPLGRTLGMSPEKTRIVPRHLGILHVALNAGVMAGQAIDLARSQGKIGAQDDVPGRLVRMEGTYHRKRFMTGPAKVVVIPFQPSMGGSLLGQIPAVTFAATVGVVMGVLFPILRSVLRSGGTDENRK